MEHLLGWRKNGQQLKVVTSSFESSDVSWVGRLVNNETRFEVALELEPEREGGRVVVIPWHAVKSVEVQEKRELVD